MFLFIVSTNVLRYVLGKMMLLKNRHRWKLHNYNEPMIGNRFCLHDNVAAEKSVHAKVVLLYGNAVIHQPLIHLVCFDSHLHSYVTFLDVFLRFICIKYHCYVYIIRHVKYVFFYTAYPSYVEIHITRSFVKKKQRVANKFVGNIASTLIICPGYPSEKSMFQ